MAFKEISLKPFIKIMEEQCTELELKIEDDYRKSNENQNKDIFILLTKKQILK